MSFTFPVLFLSLGFEDVALHLGRWDCGVLAAAELELIVDESVDILLWFGDNGARAVQPFQSGLSHLRLLCKQANTVNFIKANDRAACRPVA